MTMQGKAKPAYPLATAHAKKLDTYEDYSRFVRKFPKKRKKTADVQRS
jgi:hypothetical protein